MRFAVGDYVDIVIDHVPLDPSFSSIKRKLASSSGIIMRINKGGYRPYCVRLSDGETWWFETEHLLPKEYVHPMCEPDMNLDEIHKAQELMK